jgi:hypothetical protein
MVDEAKTWHSISTIPRIEASTKIDFAASRLANENYDLSKTATYR